MFQKCTTLLLLQLCRLLNKNTKDKVSVKKERKPIS